MKWMGAMIFALALAIWPGRALQAAQGAMYAWAFSVAPVLFPFMAIVPALTAPDALAVYEKALGRILFSLFRIPPSAGGAVAAGLMAGSPAGAGALARTMAAGEYSHADAVRVTALITGCSPIFLLSGVGGGMLGSAEAGVVLICVQVSALFLSGFFLRFWPLGEEKAPVPFAGEITPPVASVLGVCGNMVLFSIGTAFVTAPLSDNWKRAVTAVAELAMGMRAVQGAPLSVMAAVAGFSGLCILWQNAQVLRSCGVSLGELFCIKAMHALFSFVLCGIWMYAAGERGFAPGGGGGEIRLQVPVIAAGVLMIGILAGKLRNFCAKKAAVSGCEAK